MEPLRTSLARNPAKLAAYLFTDVWRRIHRWAQPTGLFIVIEAQTGVGKSTLVEELTAALGPAFRRQRVFHWRPGLMGRQKEHSDPVTQPHGQRSRGTLFSIAYLFGFFLDFWLGYAFLIRPALARSELDRIRPLF